MKMGNWKMSFVLGIIGVAALCAAILLGSASCSAGPVADEQEILLSFPELSSMTVGQTHPFVVGLALPANGGESLVAACSGGVRTYPESFILDKGEMFVVFGITAVEPGEAVVRFSMGSLAEDLPILVFPQPTPGKP